jgi:16S rRNA G1207 methylase RsmC
MLIAPVAGWSDRSGENVPVTEHYFTAEPAGETRIREIDFTVQGHSYSLSVAGGVFSSERLDPGTSVFLRKADLPGPQTEGGLLDLGCGYGPIAVVLATMAPKAKVWAIDVNARARDLARRNAKGLDITVAAPDEVPLELTFAQIWSNPPIHVGKPELHKLLLTWLPRLEPGGVAWLVVAKHLGSDSLQQWLINQGFPTQRHASAAGFRVLKVSRQTTA